MKNYIKISILSLSLFFFLSCTANDKSTQEKTPTDPSVLAQSDTAYFASGCFWCTEAVFERIRGVLDVTSGYSGGTSKNPTYEEVGAGRTDYAEAVMVVYNAEVVSYKDLVYMFFGSHDPTQLNRQGPDVGRQYRSAIFYRTESEKNTATAVMNELDKTGKFDKPIVTKINKFMSYYTAEDYHQNYYELHPNQPYIASVSRPKVEKFMKAFNDKLKKQYQK